MPSWLNGFVTDTFRTVLWFLAKFVLQLSDMIYKVILALFNLHLEGRTGSNSWIWDFYTVVLSVTGLFILFRLLVMLFKSSFIDDTIQKIDGSTLIQRVLAIGLVLSLVPVLMPMLSSFASSAATTFPSMVGTEDITPSDIIISSGLTDFSDTSNEISISDIPDGQKAIDYLTLAKINEKDGNEYKYIPNTENLAWIMLLGAITSYVMLFVGIQIVTRLVGLFLKIVLAPYALSGLVDPNDNAPSLWFRLCMSDFLTSFFQMVSIWIAMTIATHIPDGFNGIGKGIIFIGALFSIMTAPGGIAQLLGGDTGAQTGMQLMQQAVALGQGTQITMAGINTAVGAATALGGKVKTAGAAGFYSAGRMLGARSLNPVNANQRSELAQETDRVVNAIGSIGGPAGKPGGDSSGGSGALHESSGTYNAGTAVPFSSGSLYDSSDSGNNMAASSFPENVAPSYETAGEAIPESNGLSANNMSVDAARQSDANDGISIGVSSQGIAQYSDGRVTSPDSLLGRIAPSSRSGAMATTFASHMYQRSAARIFNSKEQRARIKAQTNLGTLKSAAGSSFSDYHNAVNAAQDRKLSKEFGRVMMKHKNLVESGKKYMDSHIS